MNTSAEGGDRSSDVIIYWALNDYGVSVYDIVVNCVLVVLSAWIILLNSLVFQTLLTRSQGGRGGERQPADWLVSSLSLADMITGVFVLYNTVYNLANFQIRIECLVRNALLCTALISSVLHLGLLTTDRYLLIILPYRYNSVCNHLSVLLFTTFTWVISLLLALLPTFGWSRGHGEEWGGEGQREEEEEEDAPVCSFFGLMHPDYLRLLVGLFFVPCLLMAVLYAHIFKVARRHSREIAAQERRGRRKDRHTWKFTKTVVIVMGLYFLSWLPMGIVIILHLEGHLDGYTVVERGNLLMYASISGFAGSIINPIIYAVKLSAVRARFAAIFCRRTIAMNSEMSMTRPSAAQAWTTDEVKGNGHSGLGQLTVDSS